jgi:hypothetical protein
MKKDTDGLSLPSSVGQTVPGKENVYLDVD